MNKAELIAAVAAKAGVSQKEAGVVVAAVLDEIKDALKKGDKVQLVGFGSFEVRAKAARTGKNPRTGETINIPASKAPAFKAGKAFKDYIG
ncbi:MAG: HU family DNA-binding protein [Clostridia bacterium]|nr:HU family DNA-binding protein [Clostridia bacterium]MBR2013505.1 HU family DNA-binding protein [Clostridia bacterium]MBR4087267.1 HU family DNA-binding protein [Clostridia bacterium]